MQWGEPNETAPVKKHYDFSKARANPYLRRLKRAGTRRPEAPAVPVRYVALSVVRAHLSRWLVRAASERVVITRRGRPAGMLIGFGTNEEGLLRSDADGGQAPTRESGLRPEYDFRRMKGAVRGKYARKPRPRPK